MAGNKIIVQNDLPVGLNVSWQLERPIVRLRSKKHSRVTIQTTTKHLVSSLNSCQAVHKRYRAANHWRNGRGWPRSEVAIKSPYIYGLISGAWQLIALLLYEPFNFNESYITIHPFFAPKIADTIILYARRC